jgi:hypothetical protein
MIAPQLIAGALPLADFESPTDRIALPEGREFPGARGRFERTQAAARGGEFGGRLHFDFSAGGHYVALVFEPDHPADTILDRANALDFSRTSGSRPRYSSVTLFVICPTPDLSLMSAIRMRIQDRAARQALSEDARLRFPQRQQSWGFRVRIASCRDRRLGPGLDGRAGPQAARGQHSNGSASGWHPQG